MATLVARLTTSFASRFIIHDYRGWPDDDGATLEEQLRHIPQLVVSDYVVDENGFRDFSRRFRYEYESRHLIEKELEYFVSIDLTKPCRDSVVVDVASQGSPYPNILRELLGCTVYRQDLCYDRTEGDMIAGDAACMPVAANSFDILTLHCSFEHFEGDADGRFLREAWRVLKPGGRLCIVPLYLRSQHVIATDPKVVHIADLPRDEGARFVYLPGWGSRFGRNYTVASFVSRILPNAEGFHKTIYAVRNARDIDTQCYMRWALLFTKSRASVPATPA